MFCDMTCQAVLQGSAHDAEQLSHPELHGAPLGAPLALLALEIQDAPRQAVALPDTSQNKKRCGDEKDEIIVIIIYIYILYYIYVYILYIYYIYIIYIYYIKYYYMYICMYVYVIC